MPAALRQSTCGLGPLAGYEVSTLGMRVRFSQSAPSMTPRVAWRKGYQIFALGLRGFDSRRVDHPVSLCELRRTGTSVGV